MSGIGMRMAEEEAEAIGLGLENGLGCRGRPGPNQL